MAITAEKPYDPSEDEKRFAHLIDEKATPPRGRTSAPRKTTAPTKAGDIPLEQIKGSIRDMYVLLGGFLSATPKTQMIGMSISAQAEQCAESIVEAAKTDARLRKALEKLFKAGAYSGIVLAHMPILMAAYMTVMSSRTPVNAEPTDEQKDAQPDTGNYVFPFPSVG